MTDDELRVAKRYRVIWEVDGVIVARSDTSTWLSARLLKLAARFIALFDHQKHEITIIKL